MQLNATIFLGFLNMLVEHLTTYDCYMRPEKGRNPRSQHKKRWGCQCALATPMVHFRVHKEQNSMCTMFSASELILR